jgi:hypothetical protein
MKNNRGQVLLEGIVVMPVLIVAFTALLYLAYHGLCYFYASYQLEEAMVCMTETSHRSSCERELRKNINGPLLFHEKAWISLQASQDKISGKIELGLMQKLSIEKNLKLPLEKNL